MSAVLGPNTLPTRILKSDNSLAALALVLVLASGLTVPA